MFHRDSLNINFRFLEQIFKSFTRISPEKHKCSYTCSYVVKCSYNINELQYRVFLYQSRYTNRSSRTRHFIYPPIYTSKCFQVADKTSRSTDFTNQIQQIHNSSAQQYLESMIQFYDTSFITFLWLWHLNYLTNMTIPSLSQTELVCGQQKVLQSSA